MNPSSEIVYLLLNALVCYGIFIASKYSLKPDNSNPYRCYDILPAQPFEMVFDPKESMIFGRLAYWLNSRAPFWINKPLFDCLACMASIHGLWFAFAVGLDIHIIPIHLFALIALNSVISNIHEHYVG